MATCTKSSEDYLKSSGIFLFPFCVELIFAEVEEGPDKFYEKCGFKKVGVWYSMLLKKGT